MYSCSRGCKQYRGVKLQYVQPDITQLPVCMYVFLPFLFLNVETLEDKLTNVTDHTFADERHEGFMAIERI